MGLAAALVVPAAPAKAADMEMGSTKVSISGQLRERIHWYASEVGSGDGNRVLGSYRARLKIKAELTDGVTAVFTPQAVGYWGENNQGLFLGESTDEPAYVAAADRGVSGTTNTVNMHEAYMLISNAFGVNGLIIKLGRQEINLGNQRLIGAVGWSQAGRSFDGVLLGYSAGDYGMAAFFYGKLGDTVKRFDAWVMPGEDEGLLSDIDLYVTTWQGKLAPFGIGGTYEITNILVNPRVHGSINTIYGRVTPAFDTDYAKVKLNLEAATQTGENEDGYDYGGYFFSVGAGASFEDVAWTPDVFIGYDYYSGDDDPDDTDLDAFWSVLPTAHKWLGHADLVWLNPNGPSFYLFNNRLPQQGDPGITDLYIKLGVKPMDKISAHLDFHYFKSAEDVVGPEGQTDDSVGWETDFAVKYKYSRNLCLTLGWDHFDPDDAYVYAYDLEDDKPEDHIWFQADLKF
jgi:hypothetical protein